MIETKIIPRVFLAELFGLGNRLLINTNGGGLPQFETVYGSNGQGLPDGELSPGIDQFRKEAYREQPPTVKGLTYTNRWGLPIFSNVVLRHGDKTLVMSDAIIEINRPKVVVKTQIAGRNGTVKEIVSWDDYQIKVRAILTNGTESKTTVGKKDFSTERWYPNAEVKKFVEICNYHGSVELLEDFVTRVLNIKNVLIESFTLVNTPQVTNMQVIEFDCVSDEAIVLELVK